MGNEEFFIFVDFANPVTRHNFQVANQMVSSGYTFALENHNFAAQHLEGNINYLPFIINDKDLLISCLCTSRLSAIYAFLTEEDCKKAQ